jgi:S1-C subfamily serine protease
MRHLLALTLVVAMIGLMAVAARCADLETALTHSVLKLELASAKENVSGRCTAVVIRAGLALTAAHCVDFERVDLVLDGTRSATVVKSNRILDLAVIKFVPHADDVPVPFATVPARMGNEAAIIGFALGKDDLYAQFGHVSRSKDRSNMLVLDVPAFHGDSGGAVVNKRLQLIGIIVQGEQDGAAEQIFAVTLDTIKDFLEGV